jgi:hypothetical protein
MERRAERLFQIGVARVGGNHDFIAIRIEGFRERGDPGEMGQCDGFGNQQDDRLVSGLHLTHSQESKTIAQGLSLSLCVRRESRRGRRSYSGGIALNLSGDIPYGMRSQLLPAQDAIANLLIAVRNLTRNRRRALMALLTVRHGGHRHGAGRRLRAVDFLGHAGRHHPVPAGTYPGGPAGLTTAPGQPTLCLHHPQDAAEHAAIEDTPGVKLAPPACRSPASSVMVKPRCPSSPTGSTPPKRRVQQGLPHRQGP